MQICSLQRLAALGLLLLAILWPASAHAHQSSFSFASLEVAEDARSAHYQVRLSSKDLFEALNLEEDRDASDAEILAGANQLNTYVFERIRLRADSPQCSAEPGPVEVVNEGERFASLRLDIRCPQVIAKLSLQYNLFFDLDPRHEGLLRVAGSLVQLSEGSREFNYDTGNKPSASSLGFLRSGFDHVLYGLDHILFLVALLLVVCLRQDGPTLQARTLVQSLRRTAGIVTAFTVGHTLTLIPAALGWIALSGRFVESMIAASIVYVAVENMLKPDPQRRYLITFSFGLMHGMGFAAMLRPLLPPEDTVVPLLLFNLGVEFGQLAIVACVLPLLYLLIRVVKVDSYRRFIMPAGCLLLSALGLVWLIERALEIEILGI